MAKRPLRAGFGVPLSSSRALRLRDQGAATEPSPPPPQGAPLGGGLAALRPWAAASRRWSGDPGEPRPRGPGRGRGALDAGDGAAWPRQAPPELDAGAAVGAPAVQVREALAAAIVAERGREPAP